MTLTTKQKEWVVNDRRKKPDKYARYNHEYIQRHPERGLFDRAKKRAKAKKLDFNLQVSDIVIPAFCPVLGIPISIGKKTIQPNSPSLDRIIPELGYVKGNVQVISARANAMKNDASRDELLRFAGWVVGAYGN